IPGGPGTVVRTGSWLLLIAGLLFTAVVSAVLWNVGRHARRVQTANQELDRALGTLDAANEKLTAQNMRFDAALNNMSQGLIMFDAAERMVVCNDRYLAMYNLSPDTVSPGCSLIDLLRLRHETGSLDRDPDQFRVEILRGVSREATT